ncbi:MAG: hypothetical protein JXR86_10020 [Spirochaetales bacterium]|nr:hypothetical protein [Spirochaetales bacterium]
MKVALILNTRKEEDEFQVEFDPPHTIEQIKKAIENMGHEYSFIEADENVMDRLRKEWPDLVFNRAEGIRGESRESHIPAILEMLGIPYVGSGPGTLAVCLNKAWTKHFLRGSEVSTPAYSVISTVEEAGEIDLLFPVILKPNREGSSIGINEDNVVYDRESLIAKAGDMIDLYREEILAEEFIEGREISIGVIVRPEEEIEIFPLLEVDFSRMPESASNVFGQIAKTVYDDLDNYICPAVLDEKLEEKLKEDTEEICRILNIREFARLDFRIDRYDRPWFLEINPLPGMDFDESTKDFSFYTLMAFKAGYDYNSLVSALVKSAEKRSGL